MKNYGIFLFQSILHIKNNMLVTLYHTIQRLNNPEEETIVGKKEQKDHDGPIAHLSAKQ